MKKDLVTKTNAYLANIAVGYVKLHNLHWNVVGPQFKAVHEYLETLYDSFANVLDEIAEVLKMFDEIPLASMKEYLAVATIKELGSDELPISEVLQIVLRDIELLKTQAEELRIAASVEDNYVLVTKLEDHLANYIKTIWFIKAMIK